MKTISAPKVTTLDNHDGPISQGVSIPFSQVSAAGVNTTFVEARLSLRGDPAHHPGRQRADARSRPTNNQPDPSNTGANGQPAIQRKEADTQVLVKDGDTTVIGGIYVRRGLRPARPACPVLRDPDPRVLLQDQHESETRQELLIFITPRIVNRQAAAVRPVASASAPAGGTQ